MIYDKIVIVVKKTAQEELVEKMGNIGQAQYMLRQAKARHAPETKGLDFEEYNSEDVIYHTALERIKNCIPPSVRMQIIERTFLTNFTFGQNEIVLTLGADGLVVNTAKYLTGQPILAVNPDPSTIEGVLLPFSIHQIDSKMITRALSGNMNQKSITMAKATLDDGQSIYAVNDLFIGKKNHTSAKYRIEWNDLSENHSSSGLIISTGAGSTGWYRSLISGARTISAQFSGDDYEPPKQTAEESRFEWDASELRFCVREPWPSRNTGANLVWGSIDEKTPMTIISQMPQDGVIFSDGVDSDYLEFNSGAVAKVEIAEKQVTLLCF